MFVEMHDTNGGHELPTPSLPPLEVIGLIDVPDFSDASVRQSQRKPYCGRGARGQFSHRGEF